MTTDAPDITFETLHMPDKGMTEVRLRLPDEVLAGSGLDDMDLAIVHRAGKPNASVADALLALEALVRATENPKTTPATTHPRVVQIRRPRMGDAPGMTCPARIRPFTGGHDPALTDAEIRCDRPEPTPHDQHAGELRDAAYLGSSTRVVWLEDDRRHYHGEWPGRCTLSPWCTLPAGHPRRCAP